MRAKHVDHPFCSSKLTRIANFALSGRTYVLEYDSFTSWSLVLETLALNGLTITCRSYIQTLLWYNGRRCWWFVWLQHVPPPKFLFWKADVIHYTRQYLQPSCVHNSHSLTDPVGLKKNNPAPSPPWPLQAICNPETALMGIMQPPSLGILTRRMKLRGGGNTFQFLHSSTHKLHYHLITLRLH